MDYNDENVECVDSVLYDDDKRTLHPSMLIQMRSFSLPRLSLLLTPHLVIMMRMVMVMSLMIGMREVIAWPGEDAFCCLERFHAFTVSLVSAHILEIPPHIFTLSVWETHNDF